MPLVGLGTVLLFIGWLGFNGGSTLAWKDQVGHILVNTILSGAAGAVSAGVLGFGVSNRLDAGQFMNGCLGGLVAVTAGANLFSSPLALLIGFVGGMAVLSTEELLEFLHIDDAVGAIPVHLGAGIWGTLAVGIFGAGDLVVQAIGVVAVGAFMVVTTSVLWLVLKVTVGIRVDEEVEEMGLDKTELGMEAYPEFGQGSRAF